MMPPIFLFNDFYNFPFYFLTDDKSHIFFHFFEYRFLPISYLNPRSYPLIGSTFMKTKQLISHSISSRVKSLVYKIFVDTYYNLQQRLE